MGTESTYDPMLEFIGYDGRPIPRRYGLCKDGRVTMFDFTGKSATPLICSLCGSVSSDGHKIFSNSEVLNMLQKALELQK